MKSLWINFANYLIRILAGSRGVVINMEVPGLSIQRGFNGFFYTVYSDPSLTYVGVLSRDDQEAIRAGRSLNRHRVPPPDENGWDIKDGPKEALK